MSEKSKNSCTDFPSTSDMLDNKPVEIYMVGALTPDPKQDNSQMYHYDFGVREKPAKEKKRHFAKTDPYAEIATPQHFITEDGKKIPIISEESDMRPTLATEAGKILYESQWKQRMDELEAAGQKDSVEYMLAKGRRDDAILMWIAERINDPNYYPDDPDEREKWIQAWTDAYTDQSMEIYGKPDKNVARRLFNEQFAKLAKLQDQYPEAWQEYVAAARDLNLIPEDSLPETIEQESLFPEAAKKVGEYLRERFAFLFDALNIREHDGSFTPEDTAAYLERAVEVLAERMGGGWERWRIMRDETADGFNVDGSKFEITVGMKRKNASPAEFEKLLTHEILRHALAATNGAELDYELQKGLPKYLAWEEGAGVMNEYGFTGELPEKAVDRYVDTAIALGAFSDDGKTRQPRSKLLRFALAQQRLRNEALPDDKRESDSELVKGVDAQLVRRIYRGTIGDDEYIGVNTKDIAYLNGLLKVGSYIERELAAGKTIEEVMDYINQGKFDPTILAHVNYLVNKQKAKLMARYQPAKRVLGLLTA